MGTTDGSMLIVNFSILNFAVFQCMKEGAIKSNIIFTSKSK